MRHFTILAVLILALSVVVYFGLNSIGLLPESASLQAETIDWLFDIEIMAISFLFSLIIVPLIYSLVVFRRKPGDTGEGEYIEGHTRLEITWTVIPLILVLALAYLGAWSLGDTLRADPEAMEVEVIASQWSWVFKYPDYGITTDELYLPIDKQVLLVMESTDVIHSFWVPEFRVKQDIIPGQETELRITPIILGDYTVRCAELCGKDHAIMTTPVVVVSDASFLSWIEEQQALIPDTVGPDPDRGETAYQLYCKACHSIDGSSGSGPTWLGLYGAEVELADGTTVIADEAFILESILDPNATIVAGYQAGMPQFSVTLTEEDIADIIAFIQTLQN